VVLAGTAVFASLAAGATDGTAAGALEAGAFGTATGVLEAGAADVLDAGATGAIAVAAGAGAGALIAGFPSAAVTSLPGAC
jgi:hypothetical protein